LKKLLSLDGRGQGEGEGNFPLTLPLSHGGERAQVKKKENNIDD
jgi:hypothetical protein